MFLELIERDSVITLLARPGNTSYRLLCFPTCPYYAPVRAAVSRSSTEVMTNNVAKAESQQDYENYRDQRLRGQVHDDVTAITMQPDIAESSVFRNIPRVQRESALAEP